MTAFTTSERLEELQRHPGINLPPPQLGVIKLLKLYDLSALCLSITNDLSVHRFPPYISQERQHFAVVTVSLWNLRHLSNTHRTKKSQIGCVLSMYVSMRERERKLYSERRKEEKVEKRRAKEAIWLVDGEEKQQRQVFITELLQLHKRSSVFNQANAPSFCFRNQHFNRNG